jgi:hypothetical protein
MNRPLLSSLLLLAAAAALDAQQPFADVSPSDSYYETTALMFVRGITSGCTATPTYCPSSAVTRGAVAVFMIRALYGENFTTSQYPYFSDVPRTHPQFPYIQKMRETGISVGYADGTYKPDDPILNHQLAIMIVRARLGTLTEPTICNSGPCSQQNYFPFESSPEYFTFYNWIQKAYELTGPSLVPPGCGMFQFCANMTVTRGHISFGIVHGILGLPAEGNWMTWNDALGPVSGGIYCWGGNPFVADAIIPVSPTSFYTLSQSVARGLGSISPWAGSTPRFIRTVWPSSRSTPRDRPSLLR